MIMSISLKLTFLALAGNLDHLLPIRRRVEMGKLEISRGWMMHDGVVLGLRVAHTRPIRLRIETLRLRVSVMAIATEVQRRLRQEPPSPNSLT